MSTAATPAPRQLATGNKFEFASHSGNTKVTYFPFAPGPIIAGHTVGASLAYTGPEGDHNFSSPQITQQETPLGTLISVVLRPEGSTGIPGSIAFSLFLPPVDMGDSKSQTFTTYAVKTVRKDSVVLLPGPQLTYEVERLHGDAEIVALPL